MSWVTTWERLKTTALRERPSTGVAHILLDAVLTLWSPCHSAVWGNSGRDGGSDPEPRLPGQLPQQHGLLVENRATRGLR